MPEIGYRIDYLIKRQQQNVKDKVAHELKFVFSRCQGLEAVLSTDQDMLREYIKSYQEAIANAKKDDDDRQDATDTRSATTPSVQDSRALFCPSKVAAVANFEKLETLAEHSLAANNYELHCADDIKDFWKSVAGLTRLFNELRKSVQDSMVDLKNAKQLVTREMTNSQQAAERKAAQQLLCAG